MANLLADLRQAIYEACERPCQKARDRVGVLTAECIKQYGDRKTDLTIKAARQLIQRRQHEIMARK